MPHFEERSFAPSAPLRAWIAEVRVMSMSASPARTLARLPNGASSLVLCTGHGGVDIVAAGPHVRASYKRAVTVPLYTRFVFRPGTARAFLGVALHELTNRVVSIAELWGTAAESMRDAVAGSNEIDRTVRTLEAALLAQLDPRGIEDRRQLVSHAARALEDTAAPYEQVPDLARRLGVSERHLRQVFREEIGISPKRYARIARIRRVIANAGRRGWARLAAESGFYDQAHLNAEFRDLMGTTPRRYLAGDLPQRGDCEVASPS